MKNKKIVVGMSGGVDSSVAALLLKEQGFDVIGLFMKNWEESDENGICQASKEFQDVVTVCDQLKIPYYSVNFTQEYQTQVFQYFLDEFKKGNTPNPDILCNREIKFKVLLDKAWELGADYLATGHYCQTNHRQLLKGADLNKDQSYFLYTLNSTILGKVLFPVGHLDKKKTREIAAQHGLATAEKKDSTGICFIGERNFKAFLNQYLPFQPGNFKTLSGQVIGSHDGCAFYTIGQRKGLNIGGAGEAWYVVGKDVCHNVVYIEQGADHPALFSSSLTATDLTWVAGEVPNLALTYTAKIRYRQEDQPCVIQKIEDKVATVSFPHPQRAVTPSQSIVFYQDNVCLGGGIIISSILT